MTKKTTDYNNLRAELDTIMVDLESSELDIDAATKAYERGLAIIKELETYLDSAENAIKKIKTTITK
jgi:exodeoxyribonuclease VII small subunit